MYNVFSDYAINILLMVGAAFTAYCVITVLCTMVLNWFVEINNKVIEMRKKIAEADKAAKKKTAEEK